jgi:NADPH-dependent glutamate synthase beta subunit-like oxidoreductase/dihydroorotate dehydrogenase/Pyruvate/2-oxoacid:ferredoxin oxidoreductase delta subunit
MTDRLLLTDAQFRAEIERCEYCEEKPCREGCPAHCSPAEFIMAARLGSDADIERAATAILTMNPLGGVCGLVCPDRFCQAKCSHHGFDRPVEIPALQATIVAKAKALRRLPRLTAPKPSGCRVAIVGAGPAGVAAAAVLAQLGHEVDLLERESEPGGALCVIPEHRLPREALRSDLAFILGLPGVRLRSRVTVAAPAALLSEGYDAVVVAAGLWQPIQLGVPGEEHAVPGLAYLRDPAAHELRGHVVVVGGGATAVDCAVLAKRRGAAAVELVALEKLSEMPLTSKELGELMAQGIHVTGRTRVTEILGPGRGLRSMKVFLPDGAPFALGALSDVAGTEQTRGDVAHVIVAIGARPGLARATHPRIVTAGDCDHGPSTVVEAVAAGKNAAAAVHALLRAEPAPAGPRPRKSVVPMAGYEKLPVPLETDFFGRTLRSPFLLSAAPPSDGYEQMKAAFDAGWAGGIMKTAFDGVPIHIPADYMVAFDQHTWGNCDNVSGHALARVCREVERLRREYPDRLVAASTGGPVTGNDDTDARGWQSNTRLLESAGVMAIEYSLSCPQGGDGTEGAIVSQNARLTSRIIDWILQAGDPGVPKLFKLTAAVTSIEVIVKAIHEVLARHAKTKAGITLANTFPTLAFRRGSKKTWDEGIVVGMSGAGVAPISNLTLASVARLGVTVSGNGGTMDYKSAAHFLALGCTTVQFCTAAMKYGYGYVDELHSGLSHLMAERGMRRMKDLIGCALPDPIVDFMALPSTKRISSVDAALCMSCGNCTRCSYRAISLDGERHPVIAAERCIGCSICTHKCFAGALRMRERTAEEARALVEG